jgi:hypothetical protein
MQKKEKDHNCFQQETIWVIKEKQRNRDVQFKDVIQEIKDLNLYITTLISKLDEKYVNKEVYILHKEETKNIFLRIEKLETFKEWINIKMWVFIWTISTASYFIADKIKDYFTN